MIKQRLIGRSNLRVKLRDDIVIEKFKSGDQDAHLYIGYECNFLRKRGLSKEAKYDGEYPTLPTEHIRQCRHKAHRALDRIWKDRKKKGEYYAFMSGVFKKDFHWGMVRSDEEADKALELTLDYLGGKE